MEIGYRGSLDGIRGCQKTDKDRLIKRLWENLKKKE